MSLSTFVSHQLYLYIISGQWKPIVHPYVNSLKSLFTTHPGLLIFQHNNSGWFSYEHNQILNDSNGCKELESYFGLMNSWINPRRWKSPGRIEPSVIRFSSCYAWHEKTKILFFFRFSLIKAKDIERETRLSWGNIKGSDIVRVLICNKSRGTNFSQIFILTIANMISCDLWKKKKRCRDTNFAITCVNSYLVNLSGGEKVMGLYESDSLPFTICHFTIVTKVVTQKLCP